MSPELIGFTPSTRSIQMMAARKSKTNTDYVPSVHIVPVLH